MERTKEQLAALLEQSANYGKQLLEEKFALERETEQLREKHLEKQEELTQQIFELRRKLEVANNTVASLQEDASERSMIQKKREASEIDQLKHESQVAKKAYEDKIRNLEFELDERTRKITSSNAESEKREKLVADLRAENAELRSGVNEKSANDEVQAAAVDRLQRELLSLQQETEERDAREAEAEMERRKLEYLKTEAEMENEDLRRKLVGCENDVGRLKEDILCLEQLLENERMAQQKAGDQRGNSLFGELDDQRKKAEEAFQLLKNRYELMEEKHGKAKETIKRLNADIQALLLVSCSSQVDEKEYAAIGQDVKRLKDEVEEKEKEIDELKLAVKTKEEAIGRLKVARMEVGAGNDGGGEERTKRNNSGGVKEEAGSHGANEDAFVKYYKNCLERQKEETAEMEKRWKDEIMEKILVRDENTKLKFENAMVKRESQRQKTENCKLTMKMTEMKNEMAARTTNRTSGGDGGAAETKATPNDAPPQKKQKIVVEKMPEDWKMKRYSESDKPSVADSNQTLEESPPLVAASLPPDCSILAPLPTQAEGSPSGPGSPYSPLEKSANAVNSAASVTSSTTPERKTTTKKKIKVLSEEEGVMKPEECNQQ